jgi:branched-chain amino acid transport system substrate-binding protein
MRETWQRRRQFWSLSAACSLAVVAAVAGCKQPDNGGGAGGTGSNGTTPGTTTRGGTAQPYSGSDILLGEYGSLSGTTATYGKSTHEGITMAVDEINKAGGVLDKKIRVKVEDDASKPEQAATVVTKLINSDNVLAVLGEVASSRSLAAAPICQAAGVPMISPSSTNPKVTQVGDYIFRTCFIDPFQGPMIARFAKDKLSAKTAAILQDVKNAYSVGLTEVITKEFNDGGGKILATESFSEGDKDFRAQLTRIKRTNPDVIFIPAYYTEVGIIARQARSLGMKQPMLGGDGWDSPKLIEIGKDAVEGCYFSTHYSPLSKDPRVVKFVADYKQRFNKVPDALAAVAYDAARITVDAIKRAGSTDRDKIRDALAATKDFPGVTGNITIDEDRNAVKPLVILQVKNKEYAYVTTLKPA